MNWEQQYLNKAQKWAPRLGKIPGVVAIFLSGSLAKGTANKDSDIDFFIIARPGQIWTARFFVFIVLKVVGQLAKPHCHAGRICPNHFITTGSLLIREKDVYAAELFSANKPLCDPEKIFPQFVHKNQEWVQSFGFGFEQKGKPTRHIKTELTWFQKLVEKGLSFMQRFIITQNPDFHRSDACIVLTDQELRFHPRPKNRS